MKSFIRYFCTYCISRLLFNQACRIVRRAPAAPVKCTKHGRGLLLTILLLPFAGCLFLIVVGFVTAR